jgi:hypothetical protein
MIEILLFVFAIVYPIVAVKYANKAAWRYEQENVFSQLYNRNEERRKKVKAYVDYLNKR